MKKVQKNQFLKVHKLKAGNITKSCEAVNISRQCYYDWMKDPDFYDKVKEIEESTIDYVESQLMELIRSKHPGSIMFYLKTQGQKRGWIEPPKTLIQNTIEDTNIMIDRVINNLISVVTKHVVDPKTLKLIADELRTFESNKE